MEICSSPSKNSEDQYSTIQLAERALAEGDPRGALQLLRSVAGSDVLYGTALHLTALAHAREGQYAEASSCLSKALTLHPSNERWRLDLARLQYAQRLWAGAIRNFEAAALHTSLRPRDLRLWAKALRIAGEYGRCIEVLEEYLSIEPDAREVRAEISELYTVCGFHHEALLHREILSDQTPDDVDSLLCLARCQFQAGRLAEAIATNRAVVDSGVSSQFHSEYLAMLLHRDGETGRSLRAAHENWGRRHTRARAEMTWTNTADPHRRIRLGYVCGEGVGAPSYYFLLPLLTFRDRSRFEVTWYHASSDSGGRTAAYAKHADRWRDVSAISDDQAVAQIRADEIDLLVDVSGHYEGHRLGIFAGEAAPVQASFPNYPCTTGLPAIGYVITDEWVCPRGAEGQYTEQAIRIPSGYLTYAIPDAPDLTRLPAAENGFVTFGVFQRPAKLSPRFWDAACEVLQRCERSQLLIHYGSRELDEPDSRARQALRSELERRGIAGERAVFAGRVSAFEHLEIISRADIALDTFPYNGQTTTCECLLMGVPVVTLSGEHHVSRVGLSILARAGLKDLCSASAEHYVERAVLLAHDRTRLLHLRSSLRAPLFESSIVNGCSITEVENAYLNMWSVWCARTK